MKFKPTLGGLLAIALLLAGCNYEVPLTARATRKIDERLLGVWLGGDDGKDPMVVRQLDDSTYVVAMDDDLYRAFHSDLAGTAFISVQELGDRRKYAYVTAEISTDGRQLTVRLVNDKIVPDDTKGRAALQKLIRAHLADPALFNKPLVFTRGK
jgi:hypothetical protein